MVDDGDLKTSVDVREAMVHEKKARLNEPSGN